MKRKQTVRESATDPAQSLSHTHTLSRALGRHMKASLGVPSTIELADADRGGVAARAAASCCAAHSEA